MQQDAIVEHNLHLDRLDGLWLKTHVQFNEAKGIPVIQPSPGTNNSILNNGDLGEQCDAFCPFNCGVSCASTAPKYYMKLSGFLYRRDGKDTKQA